MIEVYKRNEAGKDRLVAYSTTYDHLFGWLQPEDVRSFGYSPTDRTRHYTCYNEHDPERNPDYHHTFHCYRYCYVLYENDKLVTPDRLVGIFRKIKESQGISFDELRQAKRNKKSSRGKKKSVYGHCRRYRFANELRWAHAWDDEDTAPPTRKRRSYSALILCNWDYGYTCAQKNWKSQTKRKRQWKPK